MKNIVIAIVAVLATAFVNVNSASAQSVTFGSEKKGLASEPSAEMQEIAKVDSMTLDYMEAFASRKHDELMLKTSDGKTYWKGRAIEGFFIGAVGGASYIPNAKSFSYVFGAEVGYTMWWGDFLVTGRVGEINFDGLTYMAPSAVCEVRVISHTGVKTNKIAFMLAAVLATSIRKAIILSQNPVMVTILLVNRL